MTAFWTKHPPKQGQRYSDLSVDPEYSQRLQYLGDKQQNCTVRLSHVTEKDEREYYFKFTTNKNGKYVGTPGVRLFVTDLQLESPERVTEGDSVRLTCKSSCKLTDTPTFIWYRNSERLTERSNELLLKSVRREDAGRYRCAVHGHTLTSPEVYLNVTFPKYQDSSMYAAIQIGATCAVLLLLCILLFISARKKAGVSNNRQNQVQAPPRSGRDFYENDSFENVSTI
ncbi:carcinoembryonic antigen-related cell adhesion molecule 1-like [Danio aesculapii]|uniref:carcinoembryonic antigen-related cell adhesion molecule 1-like n=1 Tax=Danio aesculapii TaxID=1142201 RepID=UPI0024C0E376|nr:carcinoembryonic antigen-related cell adhesion molecule 1-like [Danio aesculapii]